MNIKHSFDFDYNEEDDILTINRPDSVFKDTEEVNDYLIYGFDKYGCVSHVEISDVTNFIKDIFDIKIPREFLKSLKKIELEQREFRNTHFFVIWFKSEKFGSKLQQQLPPSNNYKSPLLSCK